MGNSLLKADNQEAKGEIDQVAIDYRLKLIAFQDELFQSRKKLQDSDRKMADLQKKLDEYVRNKENQIAEVMFTAHMNAQRIEAQTRSQTEYIILEMEEEMRHKQKELELLQKKTNRFVDDNLSDMEGEDIGARVQIVQDNIRTFREQMGTTNIPEKPLPGSKPTKTAKVAEIKPDKERVTPARTEARQLEQINAARETEKSVKPDAKIASDALENNKTIKINNTAEVKAGKEQTLKAKKEEKVPEIKAELIEAAQPLPPAVVIIDVDADQDQAFSALQDDNLFDDQAKAGESLQPAETTMPKKRRVVARKPGKTRAKKEHAALAEADIPLEIEDQVEVLLAMDEKSEAQEQEPTAADNDLEAGWDGIQASSQMEPNERMRLDAFVDVRYYQINNGLRDLQHHALQVTIEVEVPPDNYSVRYTKVSSDVVSTLMQYDNVILNDIFPFNIIEPNPQNIALYFFNCLDDMLSLMDLVVHSLVLLELPDVQIQVNTRNTKLDNFLHQGVDELNSIRGSLIPCVETEPDSGSAFKGTISRILKKR